MTTLNKSRKHVLLVEDDPSQQQLWKVIFGRISKVIQIDVVSTVEAALSQLKVRAPDLVLCDVYLEGDRTGVDLQRQCASEFPNLPFILTSGMTAEELAKKFGFEKKAPVFLSKKNNLAQLQKDLERRLLRGHGEGIFDTFVPTTNQLLTGISVALGLTASVIQMRPKAFELAETGQSESVRNTPIVQALKDAEVQQATDDLLTKGLTPWLVSQGKTPLKKKR